ncbi:PREDICTED: ATP-dependent RNA helicase DDX24 [Trachymyrmex cornetzi]|uniref:ATP-dependent RNA helicase n=1 Tax=Trachymyrmex cornetzi TaxID=471704 RepID=A0A151J8G8_9HYME|nr:PREDICTED: ATP-dependent RNA helicase DDX24 [Trachymyrmex cornetzi]KYN21126.1 ATP-dependent RNA helicase DDX24 [Trachymyrmex cornetzi]
MTKSKRVSDNGWKPVTLEGSLLSNDIEGLIGIEELTDYNLERSSKKGKVITTRVKSTEEKKSVSKRKCPKEQEETDINNIEPSTKKSKIKKAEVKRPKIKNEKIKPANFKITDQQTDSDSDSDSYCDIDSDKNLAKINAEAWRSMGVPTAVIKALADQNFHSPTMIQTRTLPAAILGRRDILGAAETGSGKTLAFGIPIIKGILDLKNQNKDQNCPEKGTEESDSENIVLSELENYVNIVNDTKLHDCHNIPTKPLYALILTPTRELAIQIRNHLTQAAKYTDVKIAVVLGGMAAVKQERMLNKGPEIVIATPGRLWELIQEGNSHLSQIDSIRYLAIDETDRMMEKGHFQELHDLLEKMNANPAKMQKRQTFVFSATLTMVHDLPDYLDRKKKRYVRSKICKLTSNQKLQKIIQLLKIKNPKVVDLTKESGIVDNLTECRIACTIDHKDYYLYYFLKRHNGRTLVFCNSIGCVKRLATLFNILECKPLPLHANMQQRQRLKNLERFQADENGLLIATDVAARGLDIPSIEHVIHYQVPRTAENYVHRSGRTARAQKEGITVLMMEPSEKQNYIKLCKTLGRTDDLPIFPVVDRILITIKERVNVARDIDKLELKYRRQNNQKSWLQKAVEDMEMILDEEDDDESSTESEEAAALRRQLKAKKNQLRSLLSKPVFPKGFSGKYLDTNLNVDVTQDAQKAIEVMKKVIENNTDKSKDSNATSQKRQHTQKLRSKKLKKT